MSAVKVPADLWVSRRLREAIASGLALGLFLPQFPHEGKKKGGAAEIHNYDLFM